MLKSYISFSFSIEGDYAILEQTIDKMNMLNSALDKDDKLTDFYSNSMAYDEVLSCQVLSLSKIKVDQLPTRLAAATSPPQQTPSSPQVARLP